MASPGRLCRTRSRLPRSYRGSSYSPFPGVAVLAPGLFLPGLEPWQRFLDQGQAWDGPTCRPTFYAVKDGGRAGGGLLSRRKKDHPVLNPSPSRGRTLELVVHLNQPTTAALRTLGVRRHATFYAVKHRAPPLSDTLNSRPGDGATVSNLRKGASFTLSLSAPASGHPLPRRGGGN